MCGNPSNRRSQLHGGAKVKVRGSPKESSSGNHSLCNILQQYSQQFDTLRMWLRKVKKDMIGIISDDTAYPLIWSIHWSLRGSFMSQLTYFFLCMDFFPPSYGLLYCPPPFTSHSPHFLSSSDLFSLSHFSQHPFLSYLFLPRLVIQLHSFLWKWKYIFFHSFPSSFHHFSACLVLVSMDTLPPLNSCCHVFLLWQESEPVEHSTRVVAARPCPKSGTQLGVTEEMKD